MSKDLPYFKFYTAEWITGDITLEDMELQGVFINACALYWSRNCRVTIGALKARYGEAIVTLLELGHIKQDADMAVITFLDEQREEFKDGHLRNVENGKKGAEARWNNSPPVALRGEERREEKRKEEDNKKIKKKPNGFQRPTLEEITAYCSERGNTIDPAAWLDHYESNGWKVGRNAMKDWKAAVRTWERNGFEVKTVGGIPATPDMGWWQKATDDQRREASPVWIAAGYHFNKLFNTWKKA